MKNRLLTYIFIAVITISGLMSIILPDKDVSFSERRTLFSFDKLKNSEDFSGDYEKYALDHFVMRDFFRRIKAFSEYSLFRKKDNNGLYKYDEYIIKHLYPLDEKSIKNLAEKINKINDLYIKNNRVFYSLIPDKNYFVNDNNHLTVDYIKMAEILRNDVYDQIEYIDIFNSLTLNDYYKTDHHFRIDGLHNLLTTLGNGMETDLTVDGRDYQLGSYYPFYGAYYGQAAMNIDADTLLYLENDILKNCSVKIWETFTTYTEYTGIYDYQKLGTMDSYDIFLYGTKPVVTIENPKSQSDSELIIFKDSFANSLTPLLIESYNKITLIDLRLVNHTVLDNFVDFKNTDILFLYSTLLANNSYILK